MTDEAVLVNGPEYKNHTVYACDICSKVIFDSFEGLAKHMDEKHGNMVPESAELQRMTNKIQPVLADLIKQHPDRWMQWGKRTFDVAANRDAGPERLAEACASRTQLELVVQQWRPQAKVFIFGSSVVMGLWDGLSDIDFTVVDVDAMEKGEWPPNEKMGVRALTQLLRNAGFSYNNLEPIEHARVPIIKHSASVGTFRFVKEQYEKIISRSVRLLLESPASESERMKLEKSIREILGSSPEHVWWDRSGRVVGMTLKDNHDALKILLHPPSPDKSNRVLRRAPLHSEMRPDLFRIDFDLSFRTFGIKNSQLLRNFLMAHPCGRPGALVLKDWSKVSGVNNSVAGFLTSYAINILWIYYLFRKGFVPYCDPQSIPESLAGNTDYDPIYTPLVPPEANTPEGRQKLYTQMGEQLIGFFAFYVYEFDWTNHVVSLNRPDITTKAQLQWTENDEIRLSKKGKNVNYLMAIEDPYEDNLNLGRHLGANRVRKIQAELQRALISLVKDNVNDTCVFAPISTDTKKDQDPPVEAVTRLMAVAVEAVERAKNTITEKELRAAFIEKQEEAFNKVSEFWSWKEMVRRLGYKLAGDVVVPFRGVPRRPMKEAVTAATPTAAVDDKTTAKTPPANTEESTGATPEAESSTDATAVAQAKVDIVDKLLDEFVTESSKASPEVLPDWVVWTPSSRPSQSVGGGGDRGGDRGGKRDERSGGGRGDGKAAAASSSFSSSSAQICNNAPLLVQPMMAPSMPLPAGVGVNTMTPAWIRSNALMQQRPPSAASLMRATVRRFF